MVESSHKFYPNTMPKWLRGIANDRAKLMGKRFQDALIHEELLDIHRPVISPEMMKHPKFVLWFCMRGIKSKF